MTRIIAGEARGRRLKVPPGTLTRPTSDRVREALFSSLETRGQWEGARVLDLYAGSGALGLEALSRGAGRATLVERDRAALRVLRANVAVVGLPGAEVVAGDVGRIVAAPAPAPYDLVLMDPPYPLGADEVTGVLSALVAAGWCAPGAVLVVERATRSPDLHWPAGLGADGSRTYGETTLWYGRADP